MQPGAECFCLDRGAMNVAQRVQREVPRGQGAAFQRGWDGSILRPQQAVTEDCDTVRLADARELLLYNFRGA